MRYSQPRKLNTKRGQLRSEHNAWCIKCRNPMAKHGKNFSCDTCHWATRITATSKGKLTFASRSSFITGQMLRRLPEKIFYPHCFRCKIRMLRMSGKSTASPLRYRCRNCGNTAQSHCDGRGRIDERRRAVKAMIAEGYDNLTIIRKLKVHHSTVISIRSTTSEVARCQCGQVRFHKSKCFRRKAFRGLEREYRSLFDDVLLRIRRRVESGLPEEVREEIVQQMLLETQESINGVLNRVPDYVKWYKKEYPWRISIDADPTMEERIAG